jgi:hypothetical protein
MTENTETENTELTPKQGCITLLIVILIPLFFINLCDNDSGTGSFGLIEVRHMKNVKTTNKGMMIIKKFTTEYDKEYRDLNDEWIESGKNNTESLSRSKDEVRDKYTELIYYLNMNTDLHSDDKRRLEDVIQDKWNVLRNRNFK